MFVIAIVFATPRDIMLIKGIPEVMALILTGAAVAVSGFRLKVEDNPLVPLMFAFCLAFFSREIHFAGTSDGVYVAVLAIGIWAWRRRERLVNPVNTGRFKAWLFAAGWTYFLALLIQRRFFKHVLPEPLLAWEQAIHVPMEEWMETVAHTLLLVTVLSGFSRVLKK
jgi:hypothetical protein